VAPDGEGDGGLMESFVALVATTMNAGTPLLLAALGIVISERSGVVNLGIEGMMLVAAVLGFTIVHWTGSYGLGFVAGAVAGAALAVLFGAMTLGLLTNQFATGLALALFGAGLSAFIGQPLQGMTLPARGRDGIPVLQDIPVLGPALFGQHWLVYGALALAGAVAWFLFRTRGGLVLRAVGESPESAHALGYPVRRIRFAALAFGGACAGLAGAYLSTVYTPLWSEGMVAGRGWIALALVTFATWRPARVLLGAYLFGGVTMLQFHLQGLGVEVATQLLAMTPYLATIVVLALISRNPRWIRLNMPASLGKPFNPNA
jgi:general nucleoside transport system permease protein